MDPSDTPAPEAGTPEAVPASAEGSPPTQAADTQDPSPNPPAAMSTIKEDDETEPGGDEVEKQADAYALEDHMEFPSLSAAAQFATLPKRKQTDRSLLKSVTPDIDDAGLPIAAVWNIPQRSPVPAQKALPTLISLEIPASEQEAKRELPTVVSLEVPAPEAETIGDPLALDHPLSHEVPTSEATATRSPPAVTVTSPAFDLLPSFEPPASEAEASHLPPTLDLPVETDRSHASTATTVPNMYSTSTKLNPQSSRLGGSCPFANLYDSAKKQLNVDSPSFTPAQLGTKKSTFSSQTANATPFTPKGAASATPQGISQDGDVGFMNPAAAREFTPQTQNYDLNTTTATNGMNNESSASIYDPYTMAGMNQALSATPYNPYAEDHNPMAAAGASYYPTPGVYTAPVQPLQYHLYAPVGPARSDLQAYQRQSHDFYIPPEMREDLQKKSAATRQVMHSSQLPDVQPYHSLVPLEGLKSGQSSLFGSTVCWVYKATSKKNGHVYCLRRLQGVRVSGKDSTNTPLSKWKRISNGSIVTPVEVFTSRDFGDTSLIFIHNYHPCSKTLAEHHLTAARFKLAIPETVIWSYICQICNALRTIHDADLAARCIHPTKIILTEKNRIRLSACMILDVLEYDSPRPLAELQHEDLIDLGKLIMSLCLNQNQVHNVQASWQSLQQSTYTDELKELVFWLISPPSIEARDQKHIGYLSQSIAHHLFDSFDAAFHAYDEILSELHKELENGRVARLVMKLGTINERPEFDNDPTWAENGERYTLKLFRDYVFHQVDANNNPVLNMGHMLSCLNKLDAGIDEKVYLTSRDHQTSFVVTYKEVKKQVNNAFQELQKAGQPKPATNNRTAF